MSTYLYHHIEFTVYNWEFQVYMWNAITEKLENVGRVVMEFLNTNFIINQNNSMRFSRMLKNKFYST